MTGRLLGAAWPLLYLLAAAVVAVLLAWPTVAPRLAPCVAHLALLGRHRRTAIVGGYHWRYCGHRSHRLRLPCWRWHVYDGYCARHNASCRSSCERPDPPRTAPTREYKCPPPTNGKERS